VIDAGGAAADDGDGETDCTITASAETFEALLAGALDPTAAFMSGKIALEGSMGQALKLGSLLT
jgi:putative sterol carrier protein